MTSTSDPLSNCSTNAIVLQDFGEIAYIVCTVSLPPQNGAQATSSESKLARLRSTQKQFREASILASTDTADLQLYTFYKKVDVMKDQRAILSKFGQILRSNSCTIAYKAAARAPDLFKPEHSKLYRLFVASVLASVKLDAVDNRRILPMGQRYHVIAHPVDHSSFFPQVLQSWALLRTDMQVVMSGHIIITVSAQRTMIPFVSTENEVQRLSDGALITAKITPVALAPSGQLAVFRNGYFGRMTEANKLSAVQRANLLHWQQVFATWAETESSVVVSADDVWMELVVPVYEQVFPEPSGSPNAAKPEPRQSMGLKTFFWPAKLCFSLNVAYGQPQQIPEANGSHDPVQFIIDWYENLANGDFGLNEASSAAVSDSDDGPLLGEDGAFDNPEVFQPFGPPTFPTGQTVYPTPPDAVMTHATPAMSAGDGLAATPLNASRLATEPHSAIQAETPLTADIHAADNNDSGMYDDDLFDEMPDDAFEQVTGADEPNWDFFDKPGGPEKDDKPPEATENEPDVMDTDLPNKPAASNGETLASPAVNEGNRAVDTTSPPAETRVDAEEPTSDVALHKSKQGLNHAPPADATASRRRSSVFDAVDEPKLTLDRDQRYAASGSFFFDRISRPSSPRRPEKLDQWLRRTPSATTSSDSDTDDDDISYAESNPDKDTATDRPMDDIEMQDAKAAEQEPDLQLIENDARIVFDLVSLSHTRASLEDAVIIGRPQGLPANFDKPNFRNDFASELVRQLTQTPLLRDQYGTSSAQIECGTRNDAVLSVGITDDKSTYSFLNQLQSIVPAAVNGKQQQPVGRLTRLGDPDIAMKRLEKPLSARLSVLPFWDVLGLQPVSKAKDVSALCIYPSIAGMRDNCSQFLDRVADAYTTCGLGQHTRGTIDGITTDGLISGDSGDHGMFLGPIRKVAQALSSESQPSGSLVIYIVAQSRSETAYIYASIASFAIRKHVAQQWAKRTDRLDVTIQVVPPGFISSPDELVVPCQGDYSSLALSVFGQVPSDQQDAPPGRSDFPLTLADGRETIRFGLDAGAVWPLSQDSVLHLAYSYSEDRRWLLAAWTDSKGALAMWMAYELKSMAIGPTRTPSEIIKDIWTVSTELMAKQRGKWELVVAKAGTYEAPEVNAWMTALNAQTTTPGKAKANLVLLSIEMTPTLRLFPQPEPLKTTIQQAYGTPASTPQGGVTSPEQIVAATPTPGGSNIINAPTPPDHSFDPNVDADLSITDPFETAWAIVLPFGINQAKDLLEMRPAVASGYLVKKTGGRNRDDEGLTMMGVHLVWPTPDPSATVAGQRERELEEYLSEYRGLVALAAARGVIDRESSCVPWHVHTAVSGATALGRLI
ncbi:Mediator of RNA polymerase II transcription subunit 13 [Cyphellophora attinorum]|uniref:Mediator of RNA polymerase II transcription subunit 13 n=1 Tax=Cyphellophora attinorum TaxID=1664694 RepID=A0A0N0NLV5_9EURO|nr:Mediator of RNA polymerase II transcription subunit 13 [Phialophora attinorum]KPI39479.1 Mediator of RNA polymerase II transcription subunit 13 [Phialophora attinorum]